MSIAFDTLKTAEELKEAGFEDRQARALVRVLEAAHARMLAGLATKQDLASTEARLSARMDRLELKSETRELKPLIRFSGVVVAVASALFGALHWWPPHS